MIFIYSRGTKPRCLEYDIGKEKKTNQSVKYFELQCQYVGFGGNFLGWSSRSLVLRNFEEPDRSAS